MAVVHCMPPPKKNNKKTQEELVCEPTTCSVPGSEIEFTNKKQKIGRTTTEICSGRVI